MTKASGLVHAAQTGFAASSAYDAYRPSYPAEAVQQLLTALEIVDVKSAKIADLAAGTGKFTQLLAARPEDYDIVAVEPHSSMREELKKKKLKGVRVIDGAAESMPDIPDGSLAALVAAQSFHWFANSIALKEIHRVLQPGGVLGMIWNVEDYNSPQSWEITPGWETTIRNLTWTFDDKMPRFRHEKWRQVFADQNQSSPVTLTKSETFFSLPLGEGCVKFETWLPKEEIWKRYRTLSQIAVLEGEDLERVKKIFWDAINAAETTMDEQGRVAVHGQTFFAWTSRIPGEPLSSG